MRMRTLVQMADNLSNPGVVDVRDKGERGGQRKILKKPAGSNNLVVSSAVRWEARSNALPFCNQSNLRLDGYV